MAEVLTRVAMHDLDPHVIEVLALAVGNSSPERMAEVVETYETENSYSLYASCSGGKLGVIGFEALAEDDVRIRHIAVDPTGQKRGVGRSMITASLAQLRLTILRAETDVDAVGFYFACGFDIRLLGEKHPGVERFECTLHVK